MNDAVLFVVVYPGCEAFLQDFFHSLEMQTVKDFDLVIVNDGISLDLLNNIPFNYKLIDGCGSIAKNREIGINVSKELGYKYLILCDADDYFHCCRVEKILSGLDAYDCIVHDVDIVSSTGDIIYHNYFQLSHDIPAVLPKNYLSEKNICGFSNCGINIKKIPQQYFPEELKIVDWFLFSNLINSSFRIGFLNESLTFYRQHGGNMIGIDNFTINQFRELLSLKINHYNLMRKGNQNYQGLYEKYLKMLSCPDNIIQNSIIENRNKINNPLWWENITI